MRHRPEQPPAPAESSGGRSHDFGGLQGVQGFLGAQRVQGEVDGSEDWSELTNILHVTGGRPKPYMPKPSKLGMPLSPTHPKPPYRPKPPPKPRSPQAKPADASPNAGVVQEAPRLVRVEWEL